MGDQHLDHEVRWSDLLPSTDEVMKHAFFQHLRTKGFDLALLRAFVDQYTVISNAFPRFLASVIARLDDEHLALSVVDNLWDEFGHGNPAADHRRILARFNSAAESLGLPRRGTVCAETAVFVNGLHAIGNRESAAACFGALSFFEAVTPAEYSVIVEALNKLHAFQREELSFFLDHMNHDSEHLDKLRGATAGLVATGGENEFRLGARQALVLENTLWDGILSAARIASE